MLPVFAIALPGGAEWIVILVIVLILFGAGRLPAVFKSFGEGLKAFKDAQKPEDEVDVTPPKRLQKDGLSEAHEVKEKA